MKHTIHNLVQGTSEWSAHRDACFNASDLAAAEGVSSYEQRNALIGELATGVRPEIDAETQRRFNDGHRFEALARPLAEKIIGDDLYPMTVSIVVDGLGRPLSASLDGTRDDDSENFEHKSLNAELAASLDAGIIPDEYHRQMEQGQLINGAKRTLFMASKWEKAPGYEEEPGRVYGMAPDESGELCRYVLVAEKHCWYESNPELRAKIIPTWQQIEKDVASYKPVEIAERPQAEAISELPALVIHARGEITTSNMKEFGAALAEQLKEVRSIVLVSDQDFSNAKAAASKFRDKIKELKIVKDGMLAQTTTIGEAARMIDAWSEDLRVTALQLEKDVEREDLAKKRGMVMDATTAYKDHINALYAETKPIELNVPQPDFAAAIKGKRLYSAMQDAVDTMLANAKIEADRIAKDVRDKLAWCKANADGYGFLFNDLQQIIYKPFDDFTLLVKSRIADHQAEEARKLEAERARIRAEEEARAAAKVKAEQEEAEREQQEAAARAEREAPIINGDTAKDIRKRLNMNQQQFWTGLGACQSAGSRYESGRSIPAPCRRLIYLVHVVGVQLTPAQQAYFDAIK